MKIFMAVVLIVVIGLALFVWNGRSGLISRDQGVSGQWAQVQNVYQRRADLVPNLVASVDNFMSRQQKTLTDVIGMRQRVIDVSQSLKSAAGSGEVNPALLDSLGGQLSRQLNSFINVVVEQYPDIKGDQMYSDLMNQLEGTENRVTQERKTFNDTVREYNVYRQTGVGPLIAGAIFGFEYEKKFFEATDAAQTAPDVREVFQNP